MGLLARRLLREGYAFDDIREALVAEARVQEEEAEVMVQRRWLRRLDSLWHRLWAGRFGAWFFRVAGTGITPPTQRVLPSADATEMVLGRAATDVFNTLAPHARDRLHDVPAVIHRLEHNAERLRARGQTGEDLTQTVAALEKVRVALLRVQADERNLDDLTHYLEKAKEIGDRVRFALEGKAEVARALGDGG